MTTRAELEERREKVRQCLLFGYTRNQIVAELGLTHRQVGYAIEVIKRELDPVLTKELLLARIEALIRRLERGEVQTRVSTELLKATELEYKLLGGHFRPELGAAVLQYLTRNTTSMEEHGATTAGADSGDSGDRVEGDVPGLQAEGGQAPES